MTTVPTPDELLKRAREERDLLSKWVKTLDGFIAQLERFSGMTTPVRQMTLEEGPLMAPQRFKAKTAVGSAEAVLRENGKPMHMKAIVGALVEGGYDKQPDRRKLYSALFTSLTRKAHDRKVFKKAKKPGMFGLLEWDKKDGETS